MLMCLVGLAAFRDALAFWRKKRLFQTKLVHGHGLLMFFLCADMIDNYGNTWLCRFSLSDYRRKDIQLYKFWKKKFTPIFFKPLSSLLPHILCSLKRILFWVEMDLTCSHNEHKFAPAPKIYRQIDRQDRAFKMKHDVQKIHLPCLVYKLFVGESAHVP